MATEISVRERWLAAISYLSFFVFITLLAGNKSDFLAKHCRQGFALFCLEILATLFIAIIHATLGQIPVLGFLVIIILELGCFLFFLIFSALGFSKGLFGEAWRVPFLDEWADKIPIH